MPDETQYLKPDEFIQRGYLHEINRLLLHPLGLALEIEQQGTTDRFTGRVWDRREDPEGIYLGDDLLSAEKASKVCAELRARTRRRYVALGYVVQPVLEETVLSVSPDKAADGAVLTTNRTDPELRQEWLDGGS